MKAHSTTKLLTVIQREANMFICAGGAVPRADFYTLAGILVADEFRAGDLTEIIAAVVLDVESTDSY